MKIHWSQTALDNLTAEAEFIASERPLASRQWEKQIREAAARAGRFPWSGRRLPEAPDLGLREFVVAGYRMVYLPDADQVVIVGVRHRSLPLDRVALGIHASDADDED